MTTRKYSSTIRFAQLSNLVFLLYVLCGLCVKADAQDFKQLHPGVEYAQVEHKLGSDPVKINLLRLDLKKVRLDVHHALDKAIGLETTSSIATRKGAIAAINAGFFRLDKSEWAGDAAGTLAMNGHLLSESSNNRISILIDNRKKTEVSFSHLSSEIGIWYMTDAFQPISGINRERKDNEMVVYTPLFGDRTRTSGLGAEIVFSKCDASCFVNVVEKGGNSEIPRDGFVVSIGPEHAEPLLLRNMKVSNGRSTWVRYDTRIGASGSKSRLLHLDEDITNGVSQLIKNGKVDITWEQEKASKSFAETRHPRTAVAKLKDGKFLMMTVDGRQPGVSVGMSLQELAEYLFSLGAVDAMNLDGGGSTTMFLDGKVVNTPSDKEGERKIGDALVVTLRKKK